VIRPGTGPESQPTLCLEEALCPRRRWGESDGGAKSGSLADLQGQWRTPCAKTGHLREQRDILKKNVGASLRTVHERYARIDAMKLDYTILSLCTNLEVSPAVIMTGKNGAPLPVRARWKTKTLAKQIEAIHIPKAGKPTAAPRIVDELATGRRHGRNRIARLMKQRDLCGRHRAAIVSGTTDSHHDQPIAPNRLPKLPRPPRPTNSGGRTSTLFNSGGWLFLAAILDLYSRKSWLGHERAHRHSGFKSFGHGPAASPATS